MSEYICPACRLEVSSHGHGPSNPCPGAYAGGAKKLSANDRQPGGDHYRNKAIQPWDFITSNDIPFLEGNIIKYVCRWREKNGLKDLEKAQHYLEKLIEVETERKRAIGAGPSGV